jgi:hypothetical protein
VSCCLPRACAILETLEVHDLPEDKRLWVSKPAYDVAIAELLQAKDRLTNRCGVDPKLLDHEMRPG